MRTTLVAVLLLAMNAWAAALLKDVYLDTLAKRGKDPRTYHWYVLDVVRRHGWSLCWPEQPIQPVILSDLSTAHDHCDCPRRTQ
jgi:hypothetical protein